MNPRWHRVLTQVFLAANSLFWLPWGLINLMWPESWAGEVIPNMDVYDPSSAVARTEARAMYGGLQMAIGIFALLGAFRPKHRDSALCSSSSPSNARLLDHALVADVQVSVLDGDKTWRVVDRYRRQAIFISPSRR